MAPLAAILIQTVFFSSSASSAGQDSPWKMTFLWDKDRDGVTVQGEAMRAILSQGALRSDVHASTLQSAHNVKLRSSLSGRADSATDNPNGAVFKIPLFTDIPEAPSLVQVGGSQPAVVDSASSQAPGGSSLAGDRQGQREGEGADDVNSGAAVAPWNVKEGSSAGEPELSELRAQQHVQPEQSFSEAENPTGRVVEVPLNSELQEGDGQIQQAESKLMVPEGADGQTEGTRKAVGNVPSMAGMAALAQLVHGHSNSDGWPLESVWNSAGDHITPAPTRVARSKGGAGKDQRTDSANAATSELHAGKHEGKWSLGRKESDSDNPNGAVMKVTLNSELQEAGVTTMPQH